MIYRWVKCKMTKWIKVETNIRVHIQQHVARARKRNDYHWAGSLPEQVVLPFFLPPTSWMVKPGTGLCGSSEPAAGSPGRGQSSAPRSAVSSLLSFGSFRLYRPLILYKVLLKKEVTISELLPNGSSAFQWEEFKVKYWLNSCVWDSESLAWVVLLQGSAVSDPHLFVCPGLMALTRAETRTTTPTACGKRRLRSTPTLNITYVERC